MTLSQFLRDYLKKARMNIYASESPVEIIPVTSPVKMSPLKSAEIPIPALNQLKTMLDDLPESTRKNFFFTLYHSYYQARPGSMRDIAWNECKKQTVELAKGLDNDFVLDFMIRSEITSKDSNY